MSRMGNTLVWRSWRSAVADLADGWHGLRLLALGLAIGGLLGSSLAALAGLGSPVTTLTSELVVEREWHNRPPPREWLLHKRPIAVDRMFRKSR